MPSTTILSPVAASPIPFCNAFKKRGSSEITWSDGNTPSTAAGFSRSIRNAASPHAGAVFRATGSSIIWCRGTPVSCSAISCARYSLVITHVFSAAASGFSRSTVCWIIERSPSSASTCLARARRDRGQNRVPLPPASITGRKSIDFGMENTSYPTEARFAQ